MNFKNPFNKKPESEYYQYRQGFTKRIKTSKHNLGIEDELLNMMELIYLADGLEGVKDFDARLTKSFGNYQSYLMGKAEATFKTKE